ncbi:MAG TPA: hypothetical protein VEL28_04390 [Candidatus Binatia bacterium]|nr:hypothetical protein [Candidatus Binatia bacterium]
MFTPDELGDDLRLDQTAVHLESCHFACIGIGLFRIRARTDRRARAAGSVQGRPRSRFAIGPPSAPIGWDRSTDHRDAVGLRKAGAECRRSVQHEAKILRNSGKVQVLRGRIPALFMTFR